MVIHFIDMIFDFQWTMSKSYTEIVFLSIKGKTEAVLAGYD